MGRIDPVDGIPKHETVLSFGFIAAERLPYLKAAFNRGDPEAILEREKRRQEKKREAQGKRTILQIRTTTD